MAGRSKINWTKTAHNIDLSLMPIRIHVPLYLRVGTIVTTNTDSAANSKTSQVIVSLVSQMTLTFNKQC